MILNWNPNEAYNINEIIPQCLYNKYPAWQYNEDNKSLFNINTDCIPVYHDELNVKCECKHFATYSTSTTVNN